MAKYTAETRIVDYLHSYFLPASLYCIRERAAFATTTSYNKLIDEVCCRLQIHESVPLFQQTLKSILSGK